MTPRTHIVGAGLAGLAAACALAANGVSVVLYEAGPAAGGRCRSYFDRGLGCRIDNGNHLLMSGNSAAMGFLDQIGARATLGGPATPRYPFLDLLDDRRWTLAPSGGRVPWWLLSTARRVPDTRPWQYLRLLALRGPLGDNTVERVLGDSGVLYRRFLEPLAIAALNTRPDEGLAVLLKAVMGETLMRGGAACIPLFPRQGLSESFIDPAVAWLHARGSIVRLSRRVVSLDRQDGRVAALRLADEVVPLGVDDRIVLAVPPWVATDLLPGLTAPDCFEAILNVHFRTDVPPPSSWRDTGFIGLVGGTAEWVFAKPGIVAATISAANRLVDLSAGAIAEKVWPDVRQALGSRVAGDQHGGPDAAMPPVRVVKEKRATFAATAAQERRRPGPRTGLQNLVLAGDWTATGLPATIEGAIRSGRTAAKTLLDAA